MILPGNIFIKSIDKDFWVAPAVALVVLNILVHLIITLTQAPLFNLEKDIQTIKRKSNLKLMKTMYLQAQDPILREFVAFKLEEDPYLFIKDAHFWDQAQAMQFGGDQVQIEKNKLILQHLKAAFESSSQQVYGLSHQATSPLNWITYQFTHANFFHLFSNVIFLFLIVGILQNIVSVYWISMVYVLGGLASGLSYIMFSTDISLPLVGASGSVSALIAFLCVIKGPQNITWSYFISPFPSGYGKIFLPAFLLFPIYLLTDFTSVLVDTQGVSGAVAHSAHIGGALCGFFIGLGYIYYQRIMSKYLTV